MSQYKQGVFFSQEFVGDNSWNGFEYNCMFANRGGGRFIDVGRATGTDGRPDGRGVAVADFDADGRLDLAINNNDARPTIYLNRLPRSRNWLQLALVGSRGNRDAVGARVRLTTASGTMNRWVEAGSGYASQSSFDVHFGLGDDDRLEALEIDWPSGVRERLVGDELAASVRLNNRSVLVEAGAQGTKSMVDSESGG